MKCYRWILHIRWRQKVRNEEVKKRFGANRNVFQIRIQRKLQFFGHICRMKDAQLLKASVWCDGGQSTERETMSRMDEWYHGLVQGKPATDRADWQRVVRHAIDTNGWSRPWSQKRRCSNFAKNNFNPAYSHMLRWNCLAVIYIRCICIIWRHCAVRRFCLFTTNICHRDSVSRRLVRKSEVEIFVWMCYPVGYKLPNQGTVADFVNGCTTNVMKRLASQDIYT